MTQKEIKSLKKSIIQAKQDVTDWGKIQNNDYDIALREICNIFEAYDYEEFKKKISVFDDAHQNYYITRWFRLMSAKYDEYLFYKNENCVQNPDPKDKNWDVRIHDWEVDIKGTRLFKDMDSLRVEDIDIEALVNRFYQDQSKGMRFSVQNRLFLIHVSMIDSNRENDVRCQFDFKEKAIAEFIQNFDKVITYDVTVGNKTAKSTALFIIENTDGTMSSFYPQKKHKWYRYYDLPEIQEIRKKIIETYTNKLIFLEEPHEYYLDGVQYMCVSDVTHKYKPSDSRQMAEGCFKKWQREQDPEYKYYGMSVDEILAQWAIKSGHACEFGTEVHAFGESMFYFMTGQPDKILPECADKFKDGVPCPTNAHEEAVVKFWNDLPENFVPVLAETKVFNRNGTPYAGTFDILFYYVEAPNSPKNGLLIFDYKTNEALYSDYARGTDPKSKGRKKMALWPFNDLFDENASYYILQLGCYQIPLENLGFKVIGRRLIWLKPNGEYEKIKIENVALRVRNALDIPTATEIISKNIL